MTVPHVLVVDDHREIRDAVTRYLQRNGLRATPAADAAAMDRALAAGRVDLVVLDLMMPGEDGLSVCRRLAAAGGPPVLMLTALGDETDRIVGLEVGADDYLPKPFNPRELLARIKAILRRADRPEPVAGALTGSAVRFAGWRLDTDAQVLSRDDAPAGGEAGESGDEGGAAGGGAGEGGAARGGAAESGSAGGGFAGRGPAGRGPAERAAAGADAPVRLTTAEFRLLTALLERPRRVLSRDALLDAVSGRQAGAFDRSIDNLVSRLRRKIEADPANPAIITTVRAGGYCLTADVQRLRGVDRADG